MDATVSLASIIKCTDQKTGMAGGIASNAVNVLTCFIAEVISDKAEQHNDTGFTESIFMDLEITEQGFDAPIVTIGAAGIEMQSHFGSGRFRAYHGDGFSFWDNRYLFSADTVLQARANLPVLELHITRSGIWKGNWDGVDELDLYAGQFNLTYTPHVLTKAFFRKKMLYRSCDIHFGMDYLQSLSNDFPALDQFLLSVCNGNARSLSKRNHACTKEMLAAMDMILSSGINEKQQQYLLEMQVRTILICALEKVAGDLRKPLPVISRQQREGLLHAKKMIELNSTDPMSLSQLSIASGLNECTLKKGFRQLFGFSPYEYHVQVKMRKAKELLLETKEPVEFIAYQLGYTQTSSFGKEFKKVMGVSPSLFRKVG